jgi:hypothetical protein
MFRQAKRDRYALKHDLAQIQFTVNREIFAALKVGEFVW